MKKLTFIFLAAATVLSSCKSESIDWKPVEGQMMTRWAAEVDPKNPLPEYPRPQLVRSEWQNLNGLWNYAVTAGDVASSEINDGKILVPFAIESALSGVKRTFAPDEKLWYKRTLRVPAKWRKNGQRVILHFGAVDYISTVKVNGETVGVHTGGNTSFSYDITDFLADKGEQQLVVEVTDPSDSGRQPRGKQVLKPQGIWYTSVSGIWKTVWMEPVAAQYVKSYNGVPDIDRGLYVISTEVENASAATIVRYTALDGGKEVAMAEAKSGEKATLSIADAKLWSNKSPFLYDLKIEVLEDGRVADKVDSYFGMRKISIGKDKDGHNRIMLNNEFVFQYGFLDQGWWPDGLLTAPTEEALLFDIEFTKNAGYNTIRKHIKVESDRFYYHCDRLGMIVWQDAVSGDNFNLKDFPAGHKKNAQSAKQFEAEWKLTIDQLRNYPCIVNWVVFNEGWGQFGGPRMIDWTKKYDPSRLAEVSGWVDYGNGDIDDLHRYPGPGRVANPGKNRAFAVGEFGGMGYPEEGHLWNPEMRNWGYATYLEKDKFIADYKHAMFQLETMVGQGLSAAIYTQTTDVEGEVNGMLTYDRAIEKIPAAELAAIHAPLYGEPAKLKSVMDDATKTAQSWYYTTKKPAEGWFSQTKSPRGFRVGKAPFGYNHPENVLSYSVYEKTDAAHKKNTEWKSEYLWAWREFNLDNPEAELYVTPRYDVNIKIWINGVLLYDMPNRNPHYYHADLIPVTGDAKKSLKKGANTIAIEVNRPFRQNRPDSHIMDAGIVEAVK